MFGSCLSRVAQAVDQFVQTKERRPTGQMPMANAVTRRVGIFWDGENITIPNGYDACRAANDINREASKHGDIVTTNYYFDSTKQERLGQSQIRKKLNAMGYTPVDCPSQQQGDKETIDKQIIVDIMSFALTVLTDRSSNTVCTIVLLSGDGDYANVINKLKNFKIQCVVILQEGSRSMDLLNSATICKNWRHDILQGLANICRRPSIPSVSRLADWDTQEVSEWLTSRGLEAAVSVFRKEKITGNLLKSLTQDNLAQMGLSAFGDRMNVLSEISKLYADSLEGSSVLVRSTGGTSGRTASFTPESERPVSFFIERQQHEPQQEEVAQLGESLTNASRLASEGQTDIFLKMVYELQQNIALQRNISLREAWIKDSLFAQEWYNSGQDQTQLRILRSIAVASNFIVHKPNIVHVEYRLTRTGMMQVSEPPEIDPQRYKMVLCNQFESSKYCKYGWECAFAHGSAELRTLQSRKCGYCREYGTLSEGRLDNDSSIWYCTECHSVQ